MELDKYFFGSFSFSFLIGYLSLLLGFLLILSAKTPVYQEVALSLKEVPLSTILLASPLSVIIGLILNIIRCTINKYVFHRPIYAFEAVPTEMKEQIQNICSNILSISSKDEILLSDKHFLQARSILLPRFDEYSIKHRWLHDFLDTTVYVSIICIVIVVSRIIINSFNGVELYVFLILMLSVFFALLSLKNLQNEYTNAEIAVMIQEVSVTQKLA